MPLVLMAPLVSLVPLVLLALPVLLGHRVSRLNLLLNLSLVRFVMMELVPIIRRPMTNCIRMA